jgi:hypothetical protein
VNPFPTNVPPAEVFNVPTGLVSCDASGCSNLEVIMDNLSQTGTVSCIHGFVEARGQNGTVRILMLGDPIYAGDTITANESSSVCVKSVGTDKNECVYPTMNKTMEESAYLPGSYPAQHPAKLIKHVEATHHVSPVNASHHSTMADMWQTLKNKVVG